MQHNNIGETCFPHESSTIDEVVASVLGSEVKSAAASDDGPSRLGPLTPPLPSGPSAAAGEDAAGDDEDGEYAAFLALLGKPAAREEGDTTVRPPSPSREEPSAPAASEDDVTVPDKRSSLVRQYRQSSTLTQSSQGLSSIFLAEEGLRSNRDALDDSFPLLALLDTHDGDDDDGNDDYLNEGTTGEALEDFILQLRFYGKKALDEEAFGWLLDDIGYSRSRNGLFENFLTEISNASPHFDAASRSVSVQDLRCLYRSEPYRVPAQSAFRSGDALMAYVEDMFRRADANGNNLLDAEEIRTILHSLYDGREPTEDELCEVRAFLCFCCACSFANGKVVLKLRRFQECFLLCSNIPGQGSRRG